MSFQEFAQRLMKMEETGQNDIVVRTTHNLDIPDIVTNNGFAYIELHEDDGNAEFRLELGPVNAAKLLDFLQALEPEP